jgi:hypothetical protein
MKKLIGIVLLSIVLCICASSDISDPGDWVCVCLKCGATYTGAHPRYSCPADHGMCNCVQMPPIRIE